VGFSGKKHQEFLRIKIVKTEKKIKKELKKQEIP